MNDKQSNRPFLRGYFHQEGFFIALGACPLLIAKSTHFLSAISSVVYTIGLLVCFGVSAFYHRIHWEPTALAIMKRLDHSAIYLLIAGTFTPVCLLALPKEKGILLLTIIWITALFGILKSIFWLKSPKGISAILYVLMGWAILPYIGELKESIGISNILILAAGGISYTLGAIFYALKKPKLFANIFEHHELFHVFTIIAAVLQFIVIYQIIS